MWRRTIPIMMKLDVLFKMSFACVMTRSAGYATSQLQIFYGTKNHLLLWDGMTSVSAPVESTFERRFFPFPSILVISLLLLFERVPPFLRCFLCCINFSFDTIFVFSILSCTLSAHATLYLSFMVHLLGFLECFDGCKLLFFRPQIFRFRLIFFIKLPPILRSVKSLIPTLLPFFPFLVVLFSTLSFFTFFTH